MTVHSGDIRRGGLSLPHLLDVLVLVAYGHDSGRLIQEVI